MVGWLIVVKLLVSIAFVVGLSLVVEHVSPRVAGILSGYPLGAALSLFFIAVENGEGFAAQGALYTLGGLSASLFFYYLVSRRAKRWEMLSAAVVSVIAFLVKARILSSLELGLVQALLITLASSGFFYYLFRKIPNVLVRKKVSFKPAVLAIRALCAAAIILFVTGVAKWVGPNWAGVLSAFPVTLFPLIILVHAAYGKEQVHTIIKNFPLGLGALIIYVIVVRLPYVELGVGLGTMWAFTAATFYLIGFSLVVQRFTRKKVVVR